MEEAILKYIFIVQSKVRGTKYIAGKRCNACRHLTIITLFLFLEIGFRFLEIRYFLLDKKQESC